MARLPLFHRLGDGHGHSTVLEGACRVEPLEFDIDLYLLSQRARNILELDQGCCALAQTDNAGVFRDRQTVTVSFNEASVVTTDIH